jgi:hypothetical protein
MRVAACWGNLLDDDAGTDDRPGRGITTALRGGAGFKSKVKVHRAFSSERKGEVSELAAALGVQGCFPMEQQGVHGLRQISGTP